MACGPGVLVADNVAIVPHRLAWCLVLAAAMPACTPFDSDAPLPGSLPESECDAAIVSAAPGADASCAVGVPFGAPVLVAGLPNGATMPDVALGGLRLSRDYLTGYFWGSGLQGNQNNALYTATRCSPSGPFLGPPSPMEGSGINAIDEYQTDPTVSGDGVTLVFAQGMPNPGSPMHLYTATRQPPYPFTGAALLAGANGSNLLDLSPFLLEDGGVLYFASDRMPSQGSTDIYRASFLAGGTDTPLPVSELNTSASEIEPIVTPDDLTVYWASDRTDGNAQGSYDIWVATRDSADAPFSSLTNVTELNSPALDAPTFVTRDGCMLYFESNRDGLGVYAATKTP